MGAVNLIVVVESVQSLITHTDDNTFHIASLAAVAAALGVKLALFGYCYTLRKASSQVEVLWEDHRNDLFINSFGLLMSAGGSKLRWWLDPMGAIIVRVVGACTCGSGSDPP
jgi:divalent metal cation (Fe/Co/Zn/Cd) transporter